jgi:hypothetical protein
MCERRRHSIRDRARAIAGELIYGGVHTPPLALAPAERRLEQLLGLRAGTFQRVDRARDGAFVIRFAYQPIGGRWSSRLRIPWRRVAGYRQRSPYVRPRDVRARRKANARRTWLWLMWKISLDAPISRASYDDSPELIDELRRLILELTPPDLILLIPLWKAPA